MAAIVLDVPRGAPRPVDALAAPGRHFLLGWTVAWLAVGVAVAAGISFGAGVEFFPVLRLSVLSAEVVGYSAYASARLVSPLLARLHGALRLTLDSLIVLAGSVFGSIAVFLTDPFFTLAQFRTVLLILTLNALLAAGVAVALGTYDRMRRQIEASYRVLRERDALEREMNVAREVQRELLPHAAPSFEGLELAGVCRPAVAVGGDYYDYLQHADGRPGIVIADISGKGVPAALLMASLQASVRSLFPTVADPGQLHERLNDALCRSSSLARYATAFLADFDRGTVASGRRYVDDPERRGARGRPLRRGGSGPNRVQFWSGFYETTWASHGQVQDRGPSAATTICRSPMKCCLTTLRRSPRHHRGRHAPLQAQQGDRGSSPSPTSCSRTRIRTTG